MMPHFVRHGTSGTPSPTQDSARDVYTFVQRGTSWTPSPTQESMMSILTSQKLFNTFARIRHSIEAVFPLAFWERVGVREKYDASLCSARDVGDAVPYTRINDKHFDLPKIVQHVREDTPFHRANFFPSPFGRGLG